MIIPGHLTGIRTNVPKATDHCLIMSLTYITTAGVSLGPFPDYKSRYISGSAGELFEFAKPESAISKRLEDSLRVALKYGVRITYVGSIDDQLVAMEVRLPKRHSGFFILLITLF